MSSESQNDLKVVNYIGTDTCSFCGDQDECLSLPDLNGKPQCACVGCIQSAFREYWGAADSTP